MSKLISDYDLRPFQPTDQTAVRQLILTGLEQRFGHIDESFNPDLNDITASYIDQKATFLVLEDQQKIIGCGALTVDDDTKKIGRIERVSVDPTYQGKKIGTYLVQQLLTAAHQRQMPLVRVETNDDWHDALHLYQKLGFVPVKHEHGEIHMELAI